MVGTRRLPVLAAIEAQTDAIRAELLAVLADEGGLAPHVDMPDDAPAAPMWRTAQPLAALERLPPVSPRRAHRGTRATLPAHHGRARRVAAVAHPRAWPEALFSVLRLARTSRRTPG